MPIKNLTPHAIVFADADGNIVRTIEPEPVPARVTSRPVPAGEIEGIPLVITEFGEVSGLPEPEDGTWLIVSMIVIAACPERRDLVRPDSGPTAIRDADGRIIAVRALTR